MSDKLKILKELKSHLLKNIGSEIDSVILFGSQADNTSDVDSDYDIVILLNSKTDWKLKRKISDYCFEIEIKYNILIDSHIISKEELNSIRGKQPIFQNAIESGIYA
ncbi:MAG: nucleotidyltransferase domain-containing protein [Melioribacteraceae bacterium]|nr:nucleotidyltransferase domain-containing protein [Melioribacteraceae bacterium]